MCERISSKLKDLLKGVLDSDIENYTFTQIPNKKGEGFNGEISFIQMKNEKDGKTLDMVMKKAFVEERTRIIRNTPWYFNNEISFYKIIWPALDKFQNEKLKTKLFEKISKCYATLSDEREELIILENLKFQNFQLAGDILDERHFEYVCIQYGKFHALSFAYKQNNLQEFSDVSKNLSNIFLKISQKDSYRKYFRTAFEFCSKQLEELEDSELIAKYKKYTDTDGPDILGKASIYQGNHSIILHGDSWSNNIMFKYNDSEEPIDIRLLDFQFVYKGSPASDLSYCLYSSGSKAVLDNFEYYLTVYHTSLIRSLKAVGCDSDEYPLDVLQQEWKEYCKLGFISGLLIWYNKFYDAIQINKSSSQGGTTDITLSEETFGQRIRDIVLHMYKNDCL